MPGHSNHIVFQADTAGVYRGQCAEFCGLQHAHMALFVIAEPRAAFETWLRQQRQRAAAPRDTLAARGRSVFLSAQCVSCHTIADAANPASFGPNLTHVASRSTIAAGTLANSAAHLAAWIRDPQIAKPGATMPANPLAPADLRALVAYLGSLR